jgi:predicted transcriptional regulator
LIARRLVEKYDYTQMDAAAKLGMTQSAMSRYLALERGQKFELMADIRKRADNIARGIAKNKLSQEQLLEEVCNVCMMFRKSKGLCAFHRELAPSISESCGICFKMLEKSSYR